jgi:UDP-2-acetamido-2-deoxy-ribo-hexuluronate aminotransferase
MIKFGGLDRYFADIKEEYIMHLQNITTSGEMNNGSATKDVEHRLEKITNRKVLLVTSGSVAMNLILCRLNLTKGDEVITIGYGPPAIVGPITFCGATPKFVDIDKFGSIDPYQLDQALTTRTKAVIAIGLYGDMYDHDIVYNFCKTNKLHYINDANQSAFAKYKGTDSLKLGTYTSMGFADAKPLRTLSTFGAIICNTQEEKTIFNRMRKHGKPNRLEPISGTGLNAWPDEERAIQVKLSLDRFSRWQERRQQIANYYNDRLINLRPSPSYSTWNTHKYAVFFKDKLKTHQQLKDLGVESVIHYTESYGGAGYPITDFYVKSALSIPLHPYMTDSEVEKVVEVIKTQECIQISK